MVTTCAARSRGSSIIMETRYTASFIVTGSRRTLSMDTRSISYLLSDVFRPVALFSFAI